MTRDAVYVLIGKNLGDLRARDKVWNRMYNMLFFVKKEGISCIFVEKVWEDTQVGGCCDVLPVPLQTPFGTERFLALAAHSAIGRVPSAESPTEMIASFEGSPLHLRSCPLPGWPEPGE